VDENLITLVCDYYPPSVGGMENHVNSLSRELSSLGYKVWVITRRVPYGVSEEIFYRNVKVLRLPSVFNKYSFYMRNYDLPLLDPLFLINFIKRFNGLCSKVMHAHGTLTITLSLYKTIFQKPALMATIHDYWPICFRRDLLLPNGEICNSKNDCSKCFECLSPYLDGFALLPSFIMKVNSDILDKVDHFIAVSSFVKNILTKRGFSNKKITVIHNWVDTSVFKQNYFLKNKENTALFVGKLIKIKGIEFLVKAVPEIVKEVPDFKLRVAGDGPLFYSLLKYVKNKNLMRNVVFLGKIPFTQLQKEYEYAKIFVFPSICPEPCPTTIIEAMASGLPIIASNVGGVPELIVDNFNGKLVQRMDSQALSENIIRLLQDEELSLRYRVNSLKLVKKFDIKMQINKVLKLYEKYS